MYALLIGGFIAVLMIIIFLWRWRSTTAPVVPAAPAPASAPTPAPPVESLEQKAHNENAEYFTIASSGTTCDDGGDYQYATSRYGTADNYKDYIMGQAIDPQVVRNHAEFVADRMNSSRQNITGATMAMGELESDDSNWMGIRGRPVQVPDTGLIAQVREVNPGSIGTKRFNWSSS